MTMRPADFFAGVVFAVFSVLLGAVHPVLIGFPTVDAVVSIRERAAMFPDAYTMS